MIKNLLKSSVYYIVHFILQAIALCGLLAYAIFANKIPFSDLQNAELTAHELEAYMLSLSIPILIISAILFIIIFIAYKLIRKHPFDFKQVDLKKIVFFAFVGLSLNGILTAVVSGLCLILPSEWVNSLNETTDLALLGSSLLPIFIGTGILTPIVEELVFRYGICGTIARKNAVVGLIISSLVFGIAHGNIIQISYAALMGFFLGYIYLKTNNIWYSIMIHMAINSSTVLVSFYNAEWMYLVLIAVATIVSIVLFKMNPDIQDIFKKKPACVGTSNNNESIDNNLNNNME